MALKRDAILGTVDLPTREVHVPEWADESGDDVVFVRGLTAAEADRYSASVQSGGDLTNVRARLVVLAVVDEDGERLFGDGDDEADLLGKKSAAVLEKLSRVVLELSGMGESSVADVKGNSGAALSGGSPSS